CDLVGVVLCLFLLVALAFSLEEGNGDGSHNSSPQMTPTHTETDSEEALQAKQEKTESQAPADPRWGIPGMKAIYDKGLELKG
ncbi:MAG: hypothetical protein Q8850_02540, partial [Candidatus Phytoplasma australasiaticum]|nr:hypothetical protein [Candidatus Phytoplasma australasiaticum]